MDSEPLRFESDSTVVTFEVPPGGTKNALHARSQTNTPAYRVHRVDGTPQRIDVKARVWVSSSMGNYAFAGCTVHLRGSTSAKDPATDIGFHVEDARFAFDARAGMQPGKVVFTDALSPAFTSIQTRYTVRIAPTGAPVVSASAEVDDSAPVSLDTFDLGFVPVRTEVYCGIQYADAPYELYVSDVTIYVCLAR